MNTRSADALEGAAALRKRVHALKGLRHLFFAAKLRFIDGGTAA
jgi:hypothetical protein